MPSHVHQNYATEWKMPWTTWSTCTRGPPVDQPLSGLLFWSGWLGSGEFRSLLLVNGREEGRGCQVSPQITEQSGGGPLFQMCRSHLKKSGVKPRRPWGRTWTRFSWIFIPWVPTTQTLGSLWHLNFLRGVEVKLIKKLVIYPTNLHESAGPQSRQAGMPNHL